MLPASTQPAPGGPGNQATFTGGCLWDGALASTSPAFAPISPKDTSDLADNSLEEMPLITSITGMFFLRISAMRLFRPSLEMAPMMTALAPAATQSSICEICFLSSV